MTPIRFHPDAVVELTEAQQWYLDRSDLAAQARSHVQILAPRYVAVPCRAAAELRVVSERD